MKAEQRERMLALADRLVDVFLNECNPDTWPGLGDAISRGDTFWLKKNAHKTLVILTQLEAYLKLADIAPEQIDETVDRMIRSAQARAREMEAAIDGKGAGKGKGSRGRSAH